MGNSNTVATLLALLVILVTIISARVRSTDTSPAILHNVVWAGGLLIVGSGLLRYAPISGYAWWLIASAIFCFNSGIAISGMRKNYPLVNSAPVVTTRSLVTKGMYRTLLWGFSVGFAIYLATIARIYGLSTLINDPTSIRSYSDVSYMEAFPLYGKILFYLGPLCLVLTIFPEYVKGLRERPLLWRLTIMAYLTVAQVATLQRTNLFVGILWATGLLVLRLQNQNSDGKPRRLTPTKVLSLMVATGVALIAFQSIGIALGKTGTNNNAISSVVDPRLRNSSALSVLHYASSGISAFGRLTDSRNEEWPPPSLGRPVYGDYNPQTWGAATFAGPLKLIPGDGHWNEIGPFIYLPVPTNVYTWLDPWYRDFRLPGVLFGSLITGIVIGAFAKRRYHSPEAMLAASLLVGLSGLATFLNRYFSVMSLVIYAMLWVLGVLRRSRDTNERAQGDSEASKTHFVVRQVIREPS